MATGKTYPVLQAGFSVCVLAVAKWLVDPQNAIVWVGVIAFVGGIIFFVPHLANVKLCSNAAAKLDRAQFGAALILGASLAISLATNRAVFGDMAGARMFGVVMGLVLLFTGNNLPKLTRPLADPSGGNAIAQKAAERFAGWVFVLAGLIYIAVWLLGPADSVKLLSSSVGLSAFFLVMGRWAMLVVGNRLTKT